MGSRNYFSIKFNMGKLLCEKRIILIINFYFTTNYKKFYVEHFNAQLE